MRQFFRRGLPVGLVLILAGGLTPAAAQIPDTFTNLEVLPKDIGKGELIGIMRDFAGALGVRCNYCHVGENPNSLQGYDFASDAKEPKKVARAMVKMTGEINERLLPTTGREHLLRVQCVTCHRGVKEPETLADKLGKVADEKGVEAAVAEYRTMREEYYGQGSYDFSARTLNGLAEKRAREKQDLDGAIQLLTANVEANPDAVFSYMMLGQLQAMKGDKAAAVASLERALEIEPENPRAKQMLQRLQGSD